MNYQDFARDAFEKSAQNLRAMAQESSLISNLALATEAIVKSYKQKGCLYICGNGGSAADAQHIATELVVKLDKSRTPIKALALTTDTSLLTAVGNDFAYDKVFSRQVESFVTENDVLLAITTSGNSKNIIEALKTCRAQGGTSILLSGNKGGLAIKENLADFALLAPGNHTAQIQEAHMVIYHTLCFMIEKSLVEAGIVKFNN